MNGSGEVIEAWPDAAHAALSALSAARFGQGDCGARLDAVIERRRAAALDARLVSGLEAKPRIGLGERPPNKSKRTEQRDGPMRPRTRVLVSGVSGFVGAAPREPLDPGRLRRSTGWFAQQSQSPADRPSVTVTSHQNGTETRVDWLRTRWQACRPEVVFHLAAYGVQPGASDLIQTLRGNIDYTVSLLRATADIPGCRFVHTGSCFEYGLVEPGCLLAEDAPTQPFSPYGAAKLASIHLVCLLARRWNVTLPVCVAAVHDPMVPVEPRRVAGAQR